MDLYSYKGSIKLTIFNFALMGLLIGLTWFLPNSKVSPVEGPVKTTCPSFADGVILGYIQSALLNEISGMAASRKNANVLWAHNDSGDSARVYAMNTQGRLLGIYNLQGASAVDWEDMAIGPGPISELDYLYLGDTGDNSRTRTSIAVYRTLEPEVSAEQEQATVDLTDWTFLPMQYPASVAYDAETLLIDPISGDLFVVTRDRDDEGVARVFRNPAPQVDSVMVTLELVAEISLSMMVKGGDISPSGNAVLLRPHSAGVSTDGLCWERVADTELWKAFSDPPCLTPLEDEPQGEALAFTADGNGYLTVSEGILPPVYLYSHQYELSVSLQGGGSGTVTSLPSGINCGTDCLELFDYGSVVTLTASAESGYAFTGWGGACGHSEADCVVTIDETKSVNAYFDRWMRYIPFVVR